MTRVSLDDLDAVPIGDLTWHPVRRALGTTAFGVSAWTAAEPGDPWPLRFWNATTGDAELTLIGHDAIVTAVAFGPGGKKLASAGRDDKVRNELGVEAFGVNAVVLPAGYATKRHYHERQEELYLVLRGRATFTVGDETFDAGPGTFVQVAVGTHREAVAAAADTAVVVIGGRPGAALPVSAHEFFAAAEPAYRAGDYERAIAIASEGLADWPDHGLLNYQLACYFALAGRLDEARMRLELAFAGDERTRAWAAQDDDLAALR